MYFELYMLCIQLPHRRLLEFFLHSPGPVFYSKLFSEKHWFWPFEASHILSQQITVFFSYSSSLCVSYLDRIVWLVILEVSHKTLFKIYLVGQKQKGVNLQNECHSLLGIFIGIQTPPVIILKRNPKF